MGTHAVLKSYVVMDVGSCSTDLSTVLCCVYTLYLTSTIAISLLLIMSALRR